VKILLSAYACEPEKGSEPGVGWSLAREIARNHEVWVVTRANNRFAIEEVLRKESATSMHFLYYDLPGWARLWKKGQKGVHLYYLLWQYAAYQLAKTIHKQVGFDIVHHITFVSVRQPSFMGLLGIPFIFGPVAGGERAPWSVRIGYGIEGWLKDGLRDLFNFMVQFDPLMRLTFSSATRIFVTSEETASLIPAKYRKKIDILLAIGVEAELLESLHQVEHKKKRNRQVRVLYVGRLVHWKGLHLGLKAFAPLRKRVPGVTLTLIGSGPDERRLRNLAWKLGISDVVTWIPWMERNKILNIYHSYDIFLFPSLHDSGGMVVLEAMAAGLPVVCLNLGGPAVALNENCAMMIKVESRRQVVRDLAIALEKLAVNPDLCYELSRNGRILIGQMFNWQSVGKEISEVYNKVLNDLCRGMESL
jgi:glycosyltransferase involved in cell wall biosynthesis